MAAAKGYKITLVMPESMSIERRKMLLILGATLELTPAEKGMAGAVARAREIVEATPGAVMPQQFDNVANPLIHRVSTAEEIWNDTDGARGRGGLRRRHRRHDHRHRPGAEGPQAVACAWSPSSREASPILSGGPPGPHKIQGIGAGFVPSILDRGVIDDIVQVPTTTPSPWPAECAARGRHPGRHLVRRRPDGGLRDRQPRRSMAGKLVVAIIPSFAERYMSTALFDGL